MKIKIVVDTKHLLDIISPEEYFGLFGMAGAVISTAEIYALLLNFVVDEKGEPLTVEQAREAIKSNVKMSEFGELVGDFRRAIIDALANPTNGGK
jgi:hypothetical protein